MVFLKSSRRFFNDNLSVSFGIRTDQDNFTSENKIFENLSPRIALSLSLSRNKKWNLNFTSGRYYKMPTYTSLGFRDLNNMLTNKNSKYTQSDHIVVGLEFINSKSSRFTIELFDKRYSNYPVSSTDMVSLANKGGDFEVLGNEKTVSYTHLTLPTNREV